MSQLKLRDRLDGSIHSFDDGATLREGRWVIEREVTINGHTLFERGDLLLDDGAPRIRLGLSEIKFECPRLSEADIDNYRVALDAVAAIDAKADLHLPPERWPSPLLPAELGEESKPTELDTLLDEVLDRGHLDAIATRPRFAMRYDTELLPVDRARRLDTGFQRHLAAHSECWAARTISGVVPKSVLGRISEDDADIYEHRVYARLIDHLERYLRHRIGKLSSIEERYKKGLDFNNSEAVDHRLRTQICKVWGEAFSEGSADDLLKGNREQTRHLGRLLKRIRALKGRRINGLSRGSLYEQIPPGAQVGLGLIATNLLQHDAHYRQLSRLWRAWLAVSSSERERPVQILERRRNAQASYERYVGLVLFRALRVLGFATNWPSSIGARAAHSAWELEVLINHTEHSWRLDLDGRRLMLIPVVAPLDEESAKLWTSVSLAGGEELRIPCMLHVPNREEMLSPSDHLVPDNPGLPLSPMDLYAEEAMTTLILAWIWKYRLAGYGEIFRRLPSAVADAWPLGSEMHGTDRALLAPVEPADWQRLLEALSQHANAQIKDKVKLRKRQLDDMNRCPDCGHEQSSFNPSPKGTGFFARCRQCGCKWELHDGRFVVSADSGVDHNFASIGRRALSIEV